MLAGRCWPLNEGIARVCKHNRDALQEDVLYKYGVSMIDGYTDYCSSSLSLNLKVRFEYDKNTLLFMNHAIYLYWLQTSKVQVAFHLRHGPRRKLTSEPSLTTYICLANHQTFSVEKVRKRRRWQPHFQTHTAAETITAQPVPVDSDKTHVPHKPTHSNYTAPTSPGVSRDKFKEG
jgi:hypothetical protein